MVDIEHNLIQTSTIHIIDMINDIIDGYNGHGTKDDNEKLLFFLGFCSKSPKNKRNNYGFFLSHCEMSDMAGNLRITITGYVLNHPYNMSLEISRESLLTYEYYRRNI